MCYPDGSEGREESVSQGKDGLLEIIRVKEMDFFPRASGRSRTPVF